MTDNAELYNYIDSTRVSHKFVRQFFNPHTWLDAHEMQYTADHRTQSDFQPVTSPNNNYLVESNEMQFYDSKIFDFSSFSFISLNSFHFYTS